MSIYSEIFSAGFNVYTFLSQKSKSKNKHKRLLIREIRDNLKRLEHRNREGVNWTVLIQLLSNQSIVDAIQDDFNLKKIALGKKVEKSDIEVFAKAKRYLGWNMEQLLLSIDEKIVALKDIQKMYGDLSSSSINVLARLNNLYYLLVISVLLLRKKK